MNKTLLNSALALAVGLVGMGTAQAANMFNFVGGGPSVNSQKSAPTGSWFSMLAIDSNSDGISDTNLYTAVRAAGGTGIPGPVGSLAFDQINTITFVSGGVHSGNMIDRNWNFFGKWGAHFTAATLPLTCSGTALAPGNSCNVNMAGWRVVWNTVPAINMGGGSAGSLSAGIDGVWNTGDETLDYSAIVPAGDPSGFGGVAYGLHLVGTFDMTAAIASTLPPTFASIDADGDGVADAQDSAPLDNKIASPRSASATGNITVTITAGALTLVKTWSDTDANLNQATKPASVAFKDGLVDYTISGIGVGTTATVVIAFPSAVKVGTAIYKVKSNGTGPWTLMAATSASNPDGGYSIAADGKTVTLTIKDGGIYDDDGLANGSIHDPIGLAAAPAAAPTIPEADRAPGGGCAFNPQRGFDPTLFSMLLAGLGYIGWKRKKS